jgi:hypothetical protein
LIPVGIFSLLSGCVKASQHASSYWSLRAEDTLGVYRPVDNHVFAH